MQEWVDNLGWVRVLGFRGSCWLDLVVLNLVRLSTLTSTKEFVVFSFSTVVFLLNEVD